MATAVFRPQRDYRSDISGPEARFEGRFEGTLMRFERMDDVPNPDDTIEVGLYFDVTAKREGF